MPSTYQPGDMLALKAIEVLRADAILSSPSTGLLYPEHRPKRDVDDLRVWTLEPELPEESVDRESLPRILVGALQHPSTLEQQGEYLEAPVSLMTHVLADKEDEELVARIDARVAIVLLSTPLSDVRIIAAGLVADGLRTKGRVRSLGDAWEIVNRYRSASVGVLK